jgi:hypothetical protein
MCAIFNLSPDAAQAFEAGLFIERVHCARDSTGSGEAKILLASL